MLKIFEIEHEDGNMEWFTGSTIIEAIAAYLDISGLELDDIITSEVWEIPEEDWDEYTMDDNITFREYMKEHGDDLNIFATTYGLS